MQYHVAHSSTKRRTLLALSALLLAGTTVAPASAHAQQGSRGPSFGDGFLFGRPNVTLALRGGFARPTANSQVFDDVSTFFTVNRGDFAGGTIAGDLGLRLMERLELVTSVGLMLRTVGSESRDYVGDDDLPINQTTIFRRVPATVGLKYFLTAPGRSLGRLAWVPARWTPYVAAGGGAMYYSFKQDGEFVDFQTLAVERLALESKGWAAAGYGSAGVDLSLSPRVGLLTEARYDYARAGMSDEFVGYDRIDLSGASLSVGINFRF